ncbi:hypothetical protein D3C76_493000 [compost metagenome]
MGRRNHGKACIRGAGNALRDVEAVLIHGDRHQLRAGFQQGVPGHEVAGLFQPAGVARAHQCVADQVQAGTITCTHEHLLWVVARGGGNGWQVWGDQAPRARPGS